MHIVLVFYFSPVVVVFVVVNVSKGVRGSFSQGFFGDREKERHLRDVVDSICIIITILSVCVCVCVEAYVR